IRAAAKRGIPGIAARHDRVEEKALFVRHRLAQRQVGLHWIVIVECVWNLDDSDLGFGKKPMVRMRKLRWGTKSASKMATNSPLVCVKAWLMLPALACALSGRLR